MGDLNKLTEKSSLVKDRLKLAQSVKIADPMSGYNIPKGPALDEQGKPADKGQAPSAESKKPATPEQGKSATDHSERLHDELPEHVKLSITFRANESHHPRFQKIANHLGISYDSVIKRVVKDTILSDSDIDSKGSAKRVGPSHRTILKLSQPQFEAARMKLDPLGVSSHKASALRPAFLRAFDRTAAVVLAELEATIL